MSARVVHYLPFPAGVTYKVWQGNDQGPSHDDKWNRHAFDFSPMPESSPICATADGVVTYVKEDTAGPTGSWRDNNEVAIRHADGTVATYLHLEQDGVDVDVGDTVYAGDVIGRAGNTGNSRARHLHFGLRQGRRLGPSVPCRFAEVPDGGVPQTGDHVTSKNVPGRPLREAVMALEALYEDLSVLDAREALVDVLKKLPKRAPAAITRALDALQQREDFVAWYGQRRDALQARHAREAEEAAARLRAAGKGGELAEAIYLSTAGKREFADLDARKGFAAALKGLRSREGYTDAQVAARIRLSLRERIVRAVERDLDAHDKAARGKRVRWKSVAALYAKTVQAAEDAGFGEHAARLRRLADRRIPRGE